jgi:hypothetical protein
MKIQTRPDSKCKIHRHYCSFSASRVVNLTTVSFIKLFLKF